MSNLYNTKVKIAAAIMLIITFALTLDFFGVSSAKTQSVFNLMFAPPALGNYSNTTIGLNRNTMITPDAAPANAASATAYTTADFKGIFAVDPSTGVVTVTNAYPAGTYTVNVKAYNADGTDTKTFTLTVTAPALCSSLSFDAPVTYTAGSGTSPVGMGLGDFNGDGKQDLVTANYNNPANTISVFLRNAANTGYDPKIEYATGGAYPVSIDTADFNGDGKEDIVSGSFNSISIFLRNAANTDFDTAIVYTGINQPNWVRTGDFNGDGKADIVTANVLGFPSPTSTVSVWLRNADNTGFDPRVEYTVGSQPSSVVAADFNGDGKTDIAAANDNVSETTVSVLLRNAANTGFDTHTVYDVGTRPYSIDAGDFNGDGKQDIVTGNLFGSVSVLLRNAANTGFDTSISYPVSGNAFSVTAADMNGDGKQDIVTANNGSSVHVLLRKSDNTGFDAALAFDTGGFSAREAVVGDFNNDGKQDIASAHFSFPVLSILTGNCTGSTNPPTINATAGLTRQQGSPVSNSQIAAVNDVESGANGVTVTVTSANPSNGVTVSNIANTNGTITADIIAACNASNASFTLTATDGNSETSTAALNVNVSSNTPPTLTYSSSQTVSFDGSTTISPTTTGDNGAVTYQVLSGHGLTTPPTVDSNGVVSITNAQPSGLHMITVRATDNCGATTDTQFDLSVLIGTTTQITSDAPDPSNRNQAFTVQWTVTPQTPAAPLTGNVTVTDGVDSCTAAVTAGQCSLSLSKAGIRNLTAAYSGDASYATSTSNSESHIVKSLTPVDFDGDGISDYAFVTTETLETKPSPESNPRTTKPIGADILADERQRIWSENYNKLLMLRGGRGYVDLPKDVQASLDKNKKENAEGTSQLTTWVINYSSNNSTYARMAGSTTDIFTPADYDGDGKCDISFWSPPLFAEGGTSGLFVVIYSSNNQIWVYNLGQMGSDPTVAGDYDGDGRADPAVYDSSTGLWRYLGGANHDTLYTQVWMQGGVPAPGDYNGDGKYDFAVQLPLYSNQDAAKFRVAFNDGDVGTSSDIAISYGLAVFAIVPGDYDGDGRTDIAQANLSGADIVWRVLTSSSNYTAQVKTTFGNVATDRTVQGDYDGDGKIDRAVYRAANAPNDGVFIVKRSSDSVVTTFDWGEQFDNPVAFFNTH